MNKFAWVGCGLLMVCVLTGCGKSDDDVVKEQIAIMDDMTKELDTVKDKASAEAANPKLDGHIKRLEESVKVTKAWPKEKKDAMEKKYKEQGEASGKKFGEALVNAMLKSEGALKFDAERISKVMGDEKK